MRDMLSTYLSSHKQAFFSMTTTALFRQAAAWYPEKTAVELLDTSLTYQELDRRSDAVARYLTEEKRVEPGEVVAVTAGRSVEAVALILGIWKAGAAYAAIEPDSPAEYSRHCLESGRIRLGVDGKDLAAAVERWGEEPPFEDRSRPERLALILFTSGSTGKPKGVRILHSNITASVSNFDAIGFFSDDEYASFASLLFIASVYDIALSLTLGCTLRIVPADIRKDIRALAAYYVEKGITVSFLPPHMAKKYLAVDENSPLRLLLVGSDVPRELDKRPYRIVNIYASSEACAIISHYDIQDRRPEYPIGKLVPALKGYVVDEDGALCAPGEVGELWLSGPQLFDGYVDLPEVNERQIIPDPFDPAPVPGKVFKTSDMVRQLPSGELEYVCRRDHMYKVRGFRVELNGIEKVLLGFPGIKDACVVCFTDSGGINILFGYFIADHTVDHQALREHLGRQLPYYAVPAGLVQTDKFPRTLSGKVNRRAFAPPPELNDHKLLEKRYW